MRNVKERQTVHKESHFLESFLNISLTTNRLSNQDQQAKNAKCFRSNKNNDDDENDEDNDDMNDMIKILNNGFITKV